jgi:hypothetical protein
MQARAYEKGIDAQNPVLTLAGITGADEIVCDCIALAYIIIV